MAQTRLFRGVQILQANSGILTHETAIPNDNNDRPNFSGREIHCKTSNIANTTTAHLTSNSHHVLRQVTTSATTSSSSSSISLRPCTFVIVCGTGETDAVQEMQALLTSILLLASCPLHFIFLTDVMSADRIQTLFQHELHVAKKPIKVDIIILDMTAVKEFAKHISYNPRFHHSGLWGTSKLMIPWILQNETALVVDDNVLMIDTDMVFLGDPADLFWYEFDDDNPVDNNPENDKINNTNNASWVYKMPLDGADQGPAAICSCIVLLKWKKVLALSVYPTLFQQALKKRPRWRNRTSHLYNPPYGDQGLFFAFTKTRPDLFASLAPQWNADRCHNYLKGALLNPTKDKNKAKRQVVVSVLHNNCDVPYYPIGQGVAYFEYYKAYQWHWLRGHEKHGGHIVQVNQFTSSYFPSV